MVLTTSLAPLFAQSNKLIRELESKRGALQKQIAESESILKDTKKDVGSQLNSLAEMCIRDRNIPEYFCLLIIIKTKICIKEVCDPRSPIYIVKV